MRDLQRVLDFDPRGRVRPSSGLILPSAVMTDAGETSQRFTFPKQMRLSKRRDFQAVFEARERKSVGPLLVYARPNGLGFHRLGLSVSRRVGRAVRRNRVKRHLREAFRLLQHELPGCYDLIIVVRPHAELPLEAYQNNLRLALESLDRRWRSARPDISKKEPSGPLNSGPPGPDSPHAP